MRQMGILLYVAALSAAGIDGAHAQTMADTIISLERAALDRWGRGDPEGFLQTYADEITYFDPYRERRVNGLPAMRALYGPIVGQVKVTRYDMIEPKVQGDRNVAVLSYNLVSHARLPNGDAVSVRWNSTAVYGRSGNQWRMIHSHWSYTTPEIARPR